MKIPSQFSSSTVQFNLTPLIDVVFLLIIFFLVASHFVRNEHAAAVSLPIAPRGFDDHDAAPHRLTVTIQKDGSTFIGLDQVSLETIRSRIAALRKEANDVDMEPEVRIRADRLTLYRDLRQIVEACAAQEIHRIQFPVETVQ